MFKAISSVLLIAVSSAAWAVQTPPPAAGPEQNIVVVGERLKGFRDRLAACLARNCPPDEDIDATTALAEALFVEGEYREARNVLRASLGRNRDEAERFPEPVSDLYRATARVARHLGFDDEARRSTWQILRALRTGIPQEDHRHFTARLEIAESLVAFAQYPQALRELRELAELARAAGRDDIVATTELRGQWITYLQAPDDNRSVRRLTEMSASTDPRRSVGAKMLLIRIYNERGDQRRANAVIAQLGTGGARRQLLYAPPYELVQQDDVTATRSRNSSAATAMNRPPQPPGREQPRSTLLTANLADRMTDQFEDQIIDVSFRIRADGTVNDIQIISRRGRSGWEQPLMESIRGRRYSTTADGSETQRLERYSYTARLRRDVTGTHIPDRAPSARVEYTLLSDTIIPPTSPTR